MKLGSRQGFTCYGAIALPDDAWDEVIVKSVTDGAGLPLSIDMVFEPLSPDDFFIHIPGYFPARPDRSEPSLIVAKSELEKAGFLELIEARIRYAIGDDILEDSGIDCLDFWLPGSGFFLDQEKPIKVPWSSEGVRQWSKVIHQLKEDDESWTDLHWLAVTSRYTGYHVYNGDSLEFQRADVNHMLLSGFLDLIATRVESEYNQTNANHSLVLSSSFMHRFVITSETTETDWEWIVKRITKRDIHVTLFDDPAPYQSKSFV